MSVINNVLKDLESRSSQFTPIDIAAVDGNLAKAQSNFRWVVFLLCGLFVLALYGLYYFQTGNYLSEPVVLVEAPPASLPETSEAPLVAVLPSSNQIIGLQIKETSNQLSMEFLLREKTVSYLKERSENSFIYHLKDIESEISAPLMKGNQWIEKLSINRNEFGIDVNFKTVSGVLVNTEQNQLQNEAVWVIKLEKPPAEVSYAGLTTPAKNRDKEETVADDEPAVISKTIEKPAPVEVKKALEKKPVKVEIKTAGQDPGESAQLSLATSLINRRQWQDAEALLRGLLDGPQDMDARKQLLGIYTQPEYAEKYAALARQSSERYPQQSVFITEYARSLFQLESYQTAISLLKATEKLNAKQLALMATGYQRIDQHDNAILYYQQSLELNRQQARSWIGLGISLEHQQKPDQALKSYQAAARLGNINARLQQFIEQRSQILQRVVN